MDRFRLLIGLSVLLIAGAASAQTAPGSLHGQVTDPTGAVIPQAAVTATAPGGKAVSARTNGQGAYEVKGLTAGQYAVSVSAAGFAASPAQSVTIAPGENLQFNVKLDIEVQQQKVEVQEQGATVDVNPENNASAIVLKERTSTRCPTIPTSCNRSCRR